METKKTYRIAFAGGSSGGHVVPIVSLIQYALGINYRDISTVAELFRLGESHSLEEQECQMLNKKGNAVTFLPIMSGKMRRKPSIVEFFRNCTDMVKVGVGVVQSMRYLHKYRIQTVFCKGGYVSLPVVLAAKVLGIRVVVHESDSTPGLSTRIAAKFASKVFLGFPDVLPRGEYVGQIVSHDLMQHIPMSCGNSEEKPTILVNCGSQGSTSVHKAILELFELDTELLQSFHWVVLLGQLNKNFRIHYEQYPNVRIYDFVDQATMGELYRSADISICRGGSTTLMEQQLFGVYQIIIPIPWTHDQFRNAEYFATTYGNVVIDQSKPFWSRTLGDVILGKLKYHKTCENSGVIADQVTQAKNRIRDSLLD